MNENFVSESTHRSDQPGPLYYASLYSLQHEEYERSIARYYSNSKRRRVNRQQTPSPQGQSRRNLTDYTSKSPYRVRLYTRRDDNDDSGTSDEDEDTDEDADGEPDNFSPDDTDLRKSEEVQPPPSIPAMSPLKRSFGIFCTGKGRGTYNERPPQHLKQNHARLRYSPTPRQVAAMDSRL